jgi:DNA primase
VTVDVERLLERTSLADLVGREVPLRRRGSELHGPCPWCGGAHGARSDRFRINRDGQSWHCRQCGRGGNAIDWLQQWHGLDFLDAVVALGARLPEPKSARVVYAEEKPPDADWQDFTRAVVERAEANLWTDADLSPESETYRQALARRGITEATARTWHLGLTNPNDIPNNCPVLRGLTIPWFDYEHDLLWCLNIRRPHGAEPKYHAIGGSVRTYLFGADTIVQDETVFVVESELDAIVCWQAFGDLAGTVATGGARPSLSVRATHALSGSRVLVSYDNDPAGREAAESLGYPIARPPLEHKSLGDAHRAGVDIRQWARQHLERST